MTSKTLKFALPIAVVALGAFWAFTMANSTTTTGYETMKFECFSDGRTDMVALCTSTDAGCVVRTRTQPIPCTEQWMLALNTGWKLQFVAAFSAKGGTQSVYGLTMPANNSG